MQASDQIIARYFKVASAEVVYLKAIVESYEGMALLRTVIRDRPETWIEILIAADFAKEIEQVLQNISQEIRLKEIDRQDLPDPNHPEVTLLSPT